VARPDRDLHRRLRRDGIRRARPVAPRTILRRQVDRLAEIGLRGEVASELEFTLYRGTAEDGCRNGYESLEPTTLARADYTIQAGDAYEPFFERVRDALVASGLRPWTTQVEWGLGQWEINLEHADALEMADRHLLSLADASGRNVFHDPGPNAAWPKRSDMPSAACWRTRPPACCCTRRP
jgi:glutamine synthetase